ncbi:glyoxalase/bleomycin resistance/extradiol dioxygenase family protein [Rhodobacterales bacterium HKCCE3408]|nr:glyoxalase/bleomycin resistance/extradiol dioxygenase family protein [Rhodobacterales bacterium HKCCE3408]
MTSHAEPAPDGILEAVLYAADLDAAEAFYGGLLGLDLVRRQGTRHVFFRCGDGMVLIFNPEETRRTDGTGDLPIPPHGAEGPGHLCLAMEAPALEAMRARLEAAGLGIESDFEWPNGARSIYVRDPAGNSVEFAEPRLWGIGTA